MRTLRREREVVDAIWADQFRLADPMQRAEAVSRGDLSALIRIHVRIAA
jgi:hypothetical protein